MRAFCELWRKIEPIVEEVWTPLPSEIDERWGVFASIDLFEAIMPLNAVALGKTVRSFRDTFAEYPAWNDGYPDHGGIGALVLKRVLLACRLVANHPDFPHNIRSHLVFDETGRFGLALQAIAVHSFRRSDGFPEISATDHPVAFLLALSDGLQCWGRAPFGKAVRPPNPPLRSSPLPPNAVEFSVDQSCGMIDFRCNAKAANAYDVFPKTWDFRSIVIEGGAALCCESDVRAIIRDGDKA